MSDKEPIVLIKWYNTGSKAQFRHVMKGPIVTEITHVNTDGVQTCLCTDI